MVSMTCLAEKITTLLRATYKTSVEVRGELIQKEEQRSEEAEKLLCEAVAEYKQNLHVQQRNCPLSLVICH